MSQPAIQSCSSGSSSSPHQEDHSRGPSSFFHNPFGATGGSAYYGESGASLSSASSIPGLIGMASSGLVTTTTAASACSSSPSWMPSNDVTSNTKSMPPVNKKPSSLAAAVAAGGRPLQPPPGFAAAASAQNFGIPEDEPSNSCLTDFQHQQQQRRRSTNSSLNNSNHKKSARPRSHNTNNSANNNTSNSNNNQRGGGGGGNNKGRSASMTGAIPASRGTGYRGNANANTSSYYNKDRNSLSASTATTMMAAQLQPSSLLRSTSVGSGYDPTLSPRQQQQTQHQRYPSDSTGMLSSEALRALLKEPAERNSYSSNMGNLMDGLDHSSSQYNSTDLTDFTTSSLYTVTEASYHPGGGHQHSILPDPVQEHEDVSTFFGGRRQYYGMSEIEGDEFEDDVDYIFGGGGGGGKGRKKAASAALKGVEGLDEDEAEDDDDDDSLEALMMAQLQLQDDSVNTSTTGLGHYASTATNTTSNSLNNLSPRSKKREWLLRMNRKLQDIPVGELDPTTVPISAVMNAWAKTKSAEGASMVELWLKRAEKEHAAGNASVMPTTKMYTMAGMLTYLFCLFTCVEFGCHVSFFFSNALTFFTIQWMPGPAVARVVPLLNARKPSCSTCTSSTNVVVNRMRRFVLPTPFSMPSSTPGPVVGKR